MSDIGVWIWLDNFKVPHYFRFGDSGRSSCRKWMTFKKLEDASPRLYSGKPCMPCWKAYKKDGGTANLTEYGTVYQP